MALAACNLIHLPKIEDPRGNLTFVENSKHIPFDIKRAYYVYDIPTNSVRGGHAHKKLKQFLIAVAGSFDVTLNDGKNQRSFTLDSPTSGLYLANHVWCDINNFRAGSVCLVLTSDIYDESDYLRNYDDFIHFINNDAHENTLS